MWGTAWASVCAPSVIKGGETMEWQFFWALMRLLLFLPLVLGLAYLATRYATSLRYQWLRRGPYLAVIEHLALGPRTGLYVIRVGNRYCLFAASEGRLTLLRELEDYPAAVVEAPLRLPFFLRRALRRKEREAGAP